MRKAQTKDWAACWTKGLREKVETWKCPGASLPQGDSALAQGSQACREDSSSVTFASTPIVLKFSQGPLPGPSLLCRDL